VGEGRISNMARMNVRQMWAAKLAGQPTTNGHVTLRRSAPAAVPVVLGARKAFSGLVLGIDPSLRGTGLVLIDFAPGRQPVLLKCQTVRVAPRRSMAS